MIRDVECCPHFHRIPDAGPEVAICRLLHRLTGVEDGRLCLVPRAACVSCCEGSSPTETHLNPSLASLVFDLAGRLANAPGYDHDHAIRLRDWAEANLSLGSDPEPPISGVHTARRPVTTLARQDRPPRIGLIGWNTRSGLGTVNRGIAGNLPIDRWLIPSHPSLRELAEIPNCSVWRGTTPGEIREFLDGLDWLLFCERPYVQSIAATARAMGVRTACIPMWEYLDEFSPWIRDVDLMVCPTRACRDFVVRMQERLDLRGEVAFVPWPIDVDQFGFRPRTVCRRFLFVNGTGGARARDQRTPAWDGRKGLWIIVEAAKRAPTVPILVRSQVADLPPMPENVEVRCTDLETVPELYQDGDVCVQPSRWEGLGLPLLECQASGMPLITTDAPPMNEHHPFVALRATTTRAELLRHQAMPAYEVDPDDLAETLRQVHGTDISDASLAARRYVESEHSWPAAGPKLLAFLAPR
jgi:glycosyltransferase involved in cell wall biosynthesis